MNYQHKPTEVKGAKLNKAALLGILKTLPGVVAMPLGKAGSKRAKNPQDHGWQKKTYDSAKVIDRCIAEDRNVGFRLSDSVFVVDNDPRNWQSGLDPFLAIAHKHGIDTETGPKWKTGGGGYHQPYIIPEGQEGKFRSTLEGDENRGLEFRSGQGKMIVAPGSIHPSGKLYEVERDGPPVKAPKVLLNLARRPERSGEGVGGGTYTVPELARALDSIDPEAFGDNDSWFPLMQACHHATGGDGRDEFIAWSTRDEAYADQAGAIGARWDSLDANKNDGVTFKTLNKALRDHGDASLVPTAATSAADDFDDLDDEPPAPKAKPKANPYAGVALGAILAEKTPTYTLEGVIPKGSLFELFGREKSGKTFWALHLALCVATNRKCFGRRVAPGRVLYIIAEGNRRLFANRVLAWIVGAIAEDNAQGIKTDVAALRALIDENLRIVPVPVYLNNKDKAKALIEANPGRWSLIVVDTLFRNMDGDVNASKDMGLFVAGVDTVRRKLRATLMVLHHPGHATNGRSQGSSAFGAAIDGRAEFSKHKSGKRVWQVSYLRDSPVPEQPTFFDLQSVTLEVGGPRLDFDSPDTTAEEDGTEPDTTSAYLRVTDAPAAAPGEDGRDDAARTALDKLLIRIVEEKPATQGVLVGGKGWSRSRVSELVGELQVQGYLAAGTLKPTKRGQGRVADLAAANGDGGDENSDD